MKQKNVTNLNRNYTTEIPIEELVPGDIISLSAGDIVPADVRIVSAKDLFVNQSSLTGKHSCRKIRTLLSYRK